MRSIVEVGASVPAFLGKLWKLVNDSETDHLITWSPGGKTFFIKNQSDFARSLLPQYYKHNNMASFIRQLNMYGFHKITSVENGGLRYDKDEVEFSHPCFMKGHAYLLEHIKRKIANPKSMITSNENGEQVMVKPELMSKVLADVKQMKGKQESMDAKFSVMKQENEALWREVALLRQKHIKQQQIVNNLIQFLMSLVQPSRSGSMNAHGVKRRYQLMINDQAHNSRFSQPYAKNPKLEADLLEDLTEETLEEGPTIHELVHDDNILSDRIPSPVDPNNFVTIEIPNISPTPRPGDSSRYHVTMDESEDPEAVGSMPSPYQGTSNEQASNKTQVPSPIVMSPSSDVNLMSPAMNKANLVGTTSGNRHNLMSPNHYTISPTMDPRLPAEIFASDDSVGDACPPAMEAQRSPVATRDNSLVSRDMLLTNMEDPAMFVQPQPFNIKVEKSTDSCKISGKKKNASAPEKVNKVSLANIKTELQDDWNTMTLATVNNNGNRSRVPTMNLRDLLNNNEDKSSKFGSNSSKNLRDLLNNNEDRSSKFGSNSSKNELDDHLDTMQTDLDSLRELLRGESYSFDANTLLGVSNTDTYLFGQEDPFYGLNTNNQEERNKGNSTAQETNQLMSYTGNMPDFGDFSLAEDCEVTQDEVLADPLLGEASALNTPQVTLQSPFYPNNNN